MTALNTAGGQVVLRPVRFPAVPRPFWPHCHFELHKIGQIFVGFIAERTKIGA